MALRPEFPTDPHVVLEPAVRWYPGEAEIEEQGYGRLLPPLVWEIRKGVKGWRDRGYAGASETTRALLRHWFEREHLIPQADGTTRPFAYYFAQREAVESAIWLYEVERSRDPYALMRYDSSGQVAKGLFPEDWTRYVMKMATGSGKTKVISLLMAWAYFHRWYEVDSDLSANFLLIAPNIIVLDRLKLDFDGLKIFFEDPVLPENGYEGQNWRDDFQVTLHVQDEVGVVAETGNIFLTNIHRVYENERSPSFDDDNVMDYFLGTRPTGKTNESRVDLGQIIREVPDLIVLNDEAHHVHDADLAWFKSIQDLSQGLRLKGSKLAAQFDFTATPKHQNGGIFVQTISDYPLVEAIRQEVVKSPVLPDEASRARLQERPSPNYAEQYEDYLHLGYLEWKQVAEELERAGKKAVLFVMTDDTKNCDEVADFLERKYPTELAGKVLVIHTKNNGEISEAATGKSKEELDKLRKQSREIDSWENPYRVIVSVMVLREGWDVQNVVSIVGLRPYKAKSQILPEQTLGRGLRRMFREQGDAVRERVSVIGTQPFIEFVEQIKVEGVELEYAPMGPKSPRKSPLVIEVDDDNPEKDIEALDIELPVLSPRVQRQFKNLEELDVSSIPRAKVEYRRFTPEEQREIVFRDIDTEGVSHTTVMGSIDSVTYQSVIAYFTRRLMRDFRLVGDEAMLYGKLKAFITNDLFHVPVELENLNTLRNLSESAAVKSLMETFKTAINQLTVQDTGTTEIKDRIKLSRVRPAVVNPDRYLTPKKSVFNKIVPDQGFELKVAGFLDGCPDIVSFAKNTSKIGFRMEYQNAEGGIANYIPDFIVKQTPADIWIIETKGREDIDDPLKWERLQQWCEDATAQDGERRFRALFVREEAWDEFTPATFDDMWRTFGAGVAV